MPAACGCILRAENSSHPSDSSQRTYPNFWCLCKWPRSPGYGTRGVRRSPTVVDKAGRTRELLARYGIACPTVTGAGTGSFEFEAASGVYKQLQCDSYIFMDADYGRNRDRDGEPTKAFEPTLFVWAMVMSRLAEDRTV
jgi:D-serine deaminase-like pyridoxal phosphate-dependent protein